MSLNSHAERWWTPFKTINSVDVIHVDLLPSAKGETAAIAWLDAQEQARRRRFPYAGPRRRFSLCRAALRAVICDQLQCKNEQLTFALTQHGKPFALLDGEPAAISFNVSHSGKHGLVALAPKGRLGVDVEERDSRRNLEFLVDTVLSKREQAEFASTQGADRLHFFYKLWTIKEALIKAHGKGFSLDATRIETPLAMIQGMRGGVLQLPQMPAVTWHIEDLGTKWFAAALASEARASAILKD